jgi:hypothetical protein
MIRALKIIRKILIILLLFIVCILAVFVIISMMYEDKIAHYAVNELNKHIRTPISTSKISFTLIRKFPDATIRLRDVYIKSVPDFEQNQFVNINTDTLLYAKDLFIQMNLIKLLKKQYIIEEVHVNNGILNILNDQYGSGNFKFWKSISADDTSAFRIELQHVKASDIYLKKLNLAKKTNLQADISKLVLQGNLIKKDYQLNFSLGGNIINYNSDGFDYLSNIEVLMQSDIHVIENSYRILSSDLLIEQLGFTVEGIAEWDEKILMDMVVTGKDLNLENLVKIFPFSKPTKVLSKYKTTGVLNFNAHISGFYSNIEMPGVIADFSIQNGSFYNHQIGEKYENIRLAGQFTNGAQHHARTTEITIGKLNIESGNSRLGGTLKIKNLIKPDIHYQIKAKMDLADILPYFNTEKLEYYDGSLTIQMDIKGSQDSLFRINKEDIINWQLNGIVIPENVQFKLVQNPLTFDQINGSLVFHNYLQLNNLSSVISGNNLNVSGRVDNFFEYVLTKNGNLWLDIDVYSPDLFLDTLFMNNPEADKEIDKDILPDRIYLDSRFWVDYFHYKDFEAENVRGDIKYKPGWLLFNSFNFSAMEGTMEGNGFIEQDDHTGYMLMVNSKVKNLDIKKLFQSFNNFGQVFIQDKHLNGRLSGEVDFYSGFDQQFKIRKETIIAESDVEIEKGELIHFEPMLGLSKFIEVEELEHIKFSTLKNRIFIRQSEVIIPQMDIYSSALNVSGSGIHGFDNFFKYKVNLELSDLLLKKQREKELRFEEHVIQDDGLGRTRIFLTIEGTPDDYEINYDRKEAVQSLKDRLNDEKKELKTILKEEFGIFRNDTIGKIQLDTTNEFDFILEWEDSDFTGKDTIKKNKPDEQRFVIEWEDEENNPEEEQQQKKKKNKK